MITVVTPCGSTARANSAGVTRLLSMCTCASMRPGATNFPVRSALMPALVAGAQRHHMPVVNDDIGRVNFSADDIDQIGIAQYQVGFYVAASGRQAIYN